MHPDGKKPSVEREQTDESLRTERRQSDGALVDLQAAVENDADELVRHARELADAIVVEAREKADLAAATHPLPTVTTVRARVRADEALRDERATADEALRRQREENARILARLLPLEREKTDMYLLTERVRSDSAVTHRDDFLGMVSHDLRNLLGGIVMSASLISDRAAEGEAGNETLEGMKRIQRYSARMNRLIGDLVDVASIDAGKLALAPTKGDATMLIAEAVDMFHGPASAKGISLATELVAPTLLAEFDHDRMLQVLANLITNSIKFTASGGHIFVHGERSGAELRFSVRDDGQGVPDTMLEAIFERFWQVGKNDRRGVGLGLYISKCIVEAHGGKIWAESKIGEGTKICFTLPDAGAHT